MTRTHIAIIALACCLTLLALPTVAHDRSDVPQVAAKAPRPITIELKAAAVGDVVESFGEITGLEIAVVLSVELDGEVTVSMQDTPWPDVLTEVLAQVGLAWDQEGEYIIIKAS